MAERNKIEIHERLATLEAQVKSILENHLPSIKKAIHRLDNKFWAVIMLLIANLISLIFILIK